MSSISKLFWFFARSGERGAVFPKLLWSVLLLLLCGATASAQTPSLNYHIWDPDKVGSDKPFNDGMDRYYTNLRDFQINVPYIGWSSTNNIVDVILHNDDDSLTSALYVDYYPPSISSSITVKSNSSGVARTIRADNSRAFNYYNYSYGYDAHAHLILTEDIRVTGTIPEIDNNTYFDSGGILMHHGKLTARGTEFSNNYAGSYSSYSGGRGGAICAYDSYSSYYDNIKIDIDVDYANFLDNRASQSGGAVYLDRGEISAIGAVFSNNKAWQYIEDKDEETGEIYRSAYTGIGGGALVLTNRSTAVMDGALFEGNETLSDDSTWLHSSSYYYDEINDEYHYYENDYYYPANGGAILSENSDLSLKGATFKNNLASGSGGAIFFDANDGGRYSLQLGAFAGGSSIFDGNLHGYDRTTEQGVSNSIVFANTSGLPFESEVLGTIAVGIDVERSGVLNMNDPMAIHDLSDFRYYDYNTGQYSDHDLGAERNLDITITKSGEGIWKLGGVNELGAAAKGSKIAVQEGIFQLADGAALNLSGLTHSLDALTVAAYAQLTVGDQSSGEKNVLSTSNLVMENRSRLQLDNDLEIAIEKNKAFDVEDQSRIAATLSGKGALEKTGSGTLTYAGESTAYTGNVTLSEGILRIDADAQLTTAGNVTVRSDAVLAVVGNSDASAGVPKVRAENITFEDGAIISISGVSDTAGTEYLILQSTNRIVGDPIEESPYTGKIDYMDVLFRFNDRHTEYYAKVDLRWFATNSEKASGTFTIDPTTGSGHFNVGVNLYDRTDLEPDAVWDGRTLVKDGTGTLELSKANSYTGKTVIENGTLLLTHSRATAGTEAVSIAEKGRLTLDFKDVTEADYDRLISGKGQLVKAGSGTVRLTNTGNSYGETVLEGGVLSIEDKAVLGTGALTFTGGTFRNTERITGFDHDIKMAYGTDARFDTQADLWILGAISDNVSDKKGEYVSGEGGLVKTGQAVLTLNGKATYTGQTQVKEGTLAVLGWDNLGRSEVVLSEGATFRNLGVLAANGQSFVLEGPASGQPSGSMFDTAHDMTISGIVSGNGMLQKTGDAVLELSGENTYVGGTRINAGTVSISNVSSLGAGSLYFNGGTLRNTKKIDDMKTSINLLDGNDARFDTQADLTLASSISGSGGLVKTGAASLTLGGSNTYSGITSVEEGRLIVTGRIDSKTYVGSGATLSGSGTVGNDVYFGEGAAYEWYCNYKAEDSPYLTVMGNVDFDGAVFRPVTSASPDYFGDVVDGRTVLRYLGNLTGDGAFASVDNSLSPFIDFELDYSTPGMIKVVTYDRNTPRALSDSVAAGLNMAQVRAHRQPFNQIDNTLREGRHLGLPPNDGILRRGQSQASGRNIWGDVYGRTTKYESTYYADHPWRMNSFGVQAGYSFVATNWLNWGVTGGVEFPELKNFRDRIAMSDAFIGLYYGRRISGMWELKGYLGGGTQRYSLRRSDTRYDYRARYYGESFQANVELARPFRMRQILIRPFVGFDLEYASQQASVESRVSTEYRAYSKASLTRLFFRVGLDLEKRFSRGDLYSGIAYANAIGGSSVPSVGVYYPKMGKSATVYGSSLGQNVFTFRIGGNRYFDEIRSRALFLNMTADMYADRDGGQCEFTGTIGYSYRY